MTHFSVLCKKYECIKNIKWFMKRGGAMRVYYTVCGQRGRITNSNQLSNDVSDLYCQCTDAECGHLVVRSHLKPLGQDYEPTGAETDGIADARGTAVGTQRSGGAIAPPVVFPLSHCGSPLGRVTVALATAFPLHCPILLTCVKKLTKNQSHG